METSYGRLLISKDKKNKSELYYKFIPTKDFDIKMKEAIIHKEEWQKELEQEVNKKLGEIYYYDSQKKLIIRGENINLLKASL